MVKRAMILGALIVVVAAALLLPTTQILNSSAGADLPAPIQLTTTGSADERRIVELDPLAVIPDPQRLNTGEPGSSPSSRSEPGDGQPSLGVGVGGPLPDDIADDDEPDRTPPTPTEPTDDPPADGIDDDDSDTESGTGGWSGDDGWDEDSDDGGLDDD